jgi:hypothetical protein
MSTLPTIIAVLEKPIALICNLGSTNLVFTSQEQIPDLFESVSDEEGEPKQSTIVLNPDETYNLYQCLHTHYRQDSGV